MNATIDIPADRAYFDGHFPGRPILPAICQLALVVEALARQAGVWATLRAIPFLRLRQLIEPGDRLQVVGREEGGARVRFDVARNGVLVTNGELIFGAPELREDAAPIAGGGASVSVLHLDALMPHRPPMRFVERILAEAPDGLMCAAQIPAACPVVAGGSAPALAAIEAAAQTAAAWDAVRRHRKGEDPNPRIGYLVALRNIVLGVDRLPAARTLVASARLTGAAPPLTHYAVGVSMDGTAVLCGTIATYLTDIRSDWVSRE